MNYQYLQHLLAAWQQRFPLHSLAYQALTITVPASFDPLARELTVEAAQSLGLHNAVLLEEPQAALYGWLNMQADAWRKCLTVGDVILVVDVGGGTSDFSLMAVLERGATPDMWFGLIPVAFMFGGVTGLIAMRPRRSKCVSCVSSSWVCRAACWAC